MIQLKDLLQLSNLAELVVIAGKEGLDREISAVAVLDAPDGPTWLKGKELILSSAYMFGEDTQCINQFVADLIAAGASGLGIKMGRFVKELPPDVEALANDADFPILKIPYGLVWTDIIAPFYALKYELDNVHTIPKLDPDTITAVFLSSKWGSRHLLQKLTELFALPMAIVKSNKRIVADNDVSGVERINRMLANPGVVPEKMKQEPLEADGFFLTMRSIPLSSASNKEYLAVISPSRHAATEINKLFDLLKALSNGPIAAVADKRQIYQNFLLKVIADKITAEEIKNFQSNRSYNSKDIVYNAIMIVTGEYYGEVCEQLKEIVRHSDLNKTGKAEIYMFDHTSVQEAVVLLEYQDKIKSKIKAINNWLRGLLMRVDGQLLKRGRGCIAASSMFSSLDTISDRYKEARLSRDIGRQLWRDEIKYLYSDISFFKLLQDLEAAKVDLSDVALLEQNQNKLSFDRIATMECFLENGNYKQAAAKMFIHENTLRYRVQKICKLLNINPENPVDCYSLLTKIKLWRLFGVGAQPRADD